MRRVKSSLNDADYAELERGFRAASALIKAEQEFAAFKAEAAASAADTDEDAHRAELRRRIAAFVEADAAGASDDVLRDIAAEPSR